MDDVGLSSTNGSCSQAPVNIMDDVGLSSTNGSCSEALVDIMDDVGLSSKMGLVVELPYAFALEGQSLSSSRKSLHTSVTFWETYAP